MKTIVKSQLPVLALEIDEEGTVAQKSMQMTRQGQLENTLLDALYPGIRVATVAIPGTELDEYGRAKVEQALANFVLVGWSIASSAPRARRRTASTTPSTRSSRSQSPSVSSNGPKRRSPTSAS